MSSNGGNTAFDKIDVEAFNRDIVTGYNDGSGSEDLPADEGLARSHIPAGTGIMRDFSYIAPEIPEFIPDNCVGCMDCVTQCPDTAILAKVNTEEEINATLADFPHEDMKGFLREQFTETTKYHKAHSKKGKTPGYFGIFIDPTKCKGCAECVEVCGDHDALKMIKKEHGTLGQFQKSFDFFTKSPGTSDQFINERVLSDMMLKDEALLYVGGAGSSSRSRPTRRAATCQTRICSRTSRRSSAASGANSASAWSRTT